MPKRLITELKEYFKAGKRPTQNQFADFLESYAHLDGPQLARITDNINTENGYLRLRGMDNAIVAQISLQDIRNNMGIPNNLVQSVNGQTGNVVLDLEGSTDVGSTREGIAKHFTTNHNNTDIFHIKLPYKVNTHSAMYHIKASGYAYEVSDIIDITWVGYCYAPMTDIIHQKTGILNSAAITAGQYVGSDSHVYLWMKLPNTYYSTFKLDSMRVGNGGLITSSDVQILVSSQAQL